MGGLSRRALRGCESTLNTPSGGSILVAHAAKVENEANLSAMAKPTQIISFIPPQRTPEEAREEYFQLCLRSEELLRELTIVRRRMEEVFGEIGNEHPALDFRGGAYRSAEPSVFGANRSTSP